MESLKAAHDDPDKGATAKHKLMNLHKGKQTACAYYLDFTTYATVLTLDNAIKISFFQHGVNEELRHCAVIPVGPTYRICPLCLNVHNPQYPSQDA